MNLPFGIQIVRSKDRGVSKEAGFTGRFPKDSPPIADEFYTAITNDLFNSHNSKRDLLLYFYENVSELSSIINFIAQKAADIPYKHVKVQSNGKHKDLGRTELVQLLDKPNFLVDGKTHMKSCIVSYLLYGFVPMNVVNSVGWDTPAEIFLLPGNNFYVIPERSIDMYGKPATGVDFRMNKIKNYRLFIDNKPINYDPSEMIMMNDVAMNYKGGEYLLGKGRVYSAIRSIQSLSNVYDTVNTLLANKGAAGILTKRARANEVDGGWDPVDKKKVEDRLYSYGNTNGKRPIAVSSKDLGFTRLSVPVNEFMPIELKESDFRTIASALMFPGVLLNDKEGAIYNNVSLAEKAFYTNCEQPIVNSYYQTLTRGFNLAERNEMLIANWDDIPALAENMKDKAETNKVWNEVFEKLWEKNMVTRNQWLEFIGLPTIKKPEYDMYMDELPQEEPQNIEPDETE